MRSQTHRHTHKTHTHTRIRTHARTRTHTSTSPILRVCVCVYVASAQACGRRHGVPTPRWWCHATTTPDKPETNTVAEVPTHRGDGDQTHRYSEPLVDQREAEHRHRHHKREAEHRHRTSPSPKARPRLHTRRQHPHDKAASASSSVVAGARTVIELALTREQIGRVKDEVAWPPSPSAVAETEEIIRVTPFAMDGFKVNMGITTSCSLLAKGRAVCESGGGYVFIVIFGVCVYVYVCVYVIMHVCMHGFAIDSRTNKHMCTSIYTHFVSILACRSPPAPAAIAASLCSWLVDHLHVCNLCVVVSRVDWPSVPLAARTPYYWRPYYTVNSCSSRDLSSDSRHGDCGRTRSLDHREPGGHCGGSCCRAPDMDDCQYRGTADWLPPRWRSRVMQQELLQRPLMQHQEQQPRSLLHRPRQALQKPRSRCP